jgi:hypothetical protein
MSRKPYIERGNHVETGLTGLIVEVDETGMQKLWNTFQVIGNTAFAYDRTRTAISLVPRLLSISYYSNLLLLLPILL